MLGDRIREIRNAKGMTIKALAEKVDVTPSYISQVERNLIEPSLSSLRKIAKALSVPIYHFLADDNKQFTVIRSDERRKLELANSMTTYHFLSPFTLNDNMTPNMVAIYFKMKPDESCEESFVHNAEEFLFILSGKLKVTIGNDEYILCPGDSAYIEKNIPHTFSLPEPHPVEAISVLSPSIY